MDSSDWNHDELLPFIYPTVGLFTGKLINYLCIASVCECDESIKLELVTDLSLSRPSANHE